MNILSLFDGMSCGQIALKELGIEIYEGDIIRLHTSFTTSSQDRLGRIIFRHGAYILKYNAIEWESLVSIWHKGEIEVEVIGNVEENIDLLLEN